MEINIEAVINNMYDLMNRGVTYSMYGSRIGTDGTADCSGAVYDSLRKGGMPDAGWILNTDSMHDWLTENNWGLIAQTGQTWDMQRGDIFILGYKGSSGGAAGHTGIAVDEDNVIHCNYSANGVSVNPESILPYDMGYYIYRCNEKSDDFSSPEKYGKNGIAIDNISYEQAKELVPKIQKRYAWTLERKQVAAVKQENDVYTLRITCDNFYKYEHSIQRLKQQLSEKYPGYMQENVVWIDGDKKISTIEARNLSISSIEEDKFDIHMREFLCDVILYDQTFGQSNSYGTFDVRVIGEGFNDVDAPIVLAEIREMGRELGVQDSHINVFSY